MPARRAAVTGARTAAVWLAVFLGDPARAQSPAPSTPSPPPAADEAARRSGGVLDELLLRPRRATEEGRAQYSRGSHPQALSAFERAAGIRPKDPVARFNMADALYKNGRYDEAAALFGALGGDARSTVTAPSRFNLGNSLYQKQDYAGAIRSYRDALRLAPGDADARRNLELALRALEAQKEQQKKKQPEGQPDKRQPDERPQQDQSRSQQQQGRQDQQRPQSQQEQEDQRFRQETGMPKQRAMQLLDALQQNEKAEQRKLLAQKRAQKKKGKDW
jgi:tetratricopeptide (TPR) repeat protein